MSEENTFDTESKVQGKPEVSTDPRQGLPDSVRVEEGPPLALETAYPNASGPFVRYDGVATVRHIGPDDWKVIGIDSKKYFEWNYLNHKKIPVSKFSDQELQYLLKVDGRFSIVED